MKKVSLLLLVAFMTFGLAAQEVSGSSVEAGRKTTFKKNGFWDNWFIGAGAGANIYFGEEDQHANLFTERPSLTGYLQIGKWVNPYIGGRVKVTAGSLHTFSGREAQVMQHQRFGILQADLLFDVTNYLGRYNENRFYSLIPYVGVGAAMASHVRVHGVNPYAGRVRSAAITGGIINKFRITNRLSVDLEFAAALLKDQFDRTAGGDWSYDGNLNTSLGLTYKIGKADFQEAILADQGTIDALNNQINKLREENALLSRRPTGCPDCPEPTVIEKVVEKAGTGEFVSNVVFFRINSAVIDKHQEVSIYNTAQYLKENPSAKVKVVGYADKKTGTASINQKLSERRAKAVADALIKKHNIASNRVSVDWKGDTVQPYAENAWNRVAIFYAD